LACFFASVGASAQAFTVYDSLPQLEARIRRAGDATLVINFWATWCKPCVEELPCFEELNARYAGENVQVVLVSLDFRSLIDKKLLPFLRTQNLQSEVVLFADQDANSWIPRIYAGWDGAIPATVVLRGNKRSFNLGQFQEYADLEAFVRPYLVDSSAILKTQNLANTSGK